MADTGLKGSEIIEHVLSQLARVQKAWLAPGTSAEVRMKLVAQCAFAGLTSLAIPSPVLKLSPRLFASSGTFGEYDPNTWELEIDTSFANETLVAKKGIMALREVLDTIYHETRHHEQNFRARYYRLTEGMSAAHFKNLFETMTGRGDSDGRIANEMAQRYGIPEIYATVFLRMRRRPIAYSGQMRDEAKNWQDELWGEHAQDYATIMGAASTGGAGERQPGVFSMYRTTFLEDDGWQSGYKIADAFLAKIFNERKETSAKTLQAGVAHYKVMHSNHQASTNNLKTAAGIFKQQGGSAETMKKLTQRKADLDREAGNLEKIAIALTAKATHLKQQAAAGDVAVENAVRAHRQSVMRHRVDAHAHREANELYSGTSTAR